MHRAAADEMIESPPAAAADRARVGEGWLRVERVGGRSEVVRARAHSPLKLLTPRTRSARDGAAAHVVASGYGGGLVSGDHLRLHVEVGDGAACRLGTQASTKVYRQAFAGAPASRQTLLAMVGRGAVLAVAPDPVTCFAGSAYEQSQRVELAEGASLVLVDWLTSGRWASGERWAFDAYRSRTEILVDRKRLLLDALRLDAADGPIDAPHRCGRFNCVATAILTGPRFAAAAEALLKRLAAEPVGRGAPLAASASPLTGGAGAILRVIGMGAEPVGRYLFERLAPVADVLGGEPLYDRKW